jgi:2-dehydropantoate 2-reductase
MRFLVLGAGAIGVYTGGSLALSGHQVTFLDRPETAARLNQTGLWLTRGGRRQRVPGSAVKDSLEEALEKGAFDGILFAIKSYDTAGAVQLLSPWAGRLPPLLCLQNGVDNETALATALGPEKVIAGTVTSAIARTGPGEVVEERRRGVGVAAGHPLTGRLVEAFDQAGLNARLFPNPAEMKWSKLLTNLLGNASSAILDMTPAQVFADPRLYNLEIRQLREALAVMRALGIQVVDLPGTPVRALAFAVQRLPNRLSRPFLARAVGGGRGGKMPSLYLDLHAGRGQSEVEILNGAVVRHGERCGIKTPINRWLNETLLALASGALPRDAYAGKGTGFLERLPSS